MATKRKVAAKTPKKVVKPKFASIKACALHFLGQKRPVLSLSEVLAKVKEHFPKAGTTEGCLSWYQTMCRKPEMAEKGYDVEMPQSRPKSVKAAS